MGKDNIVSTFSKVLCKIVLLKKESIKGQESSESFNIKYCNKETQEVLLCYKKQNNLQKSLLKRTKKVITRV